MTRLFAPRSLLRTLAPLFFCLPLVAAEDDCDITLHLDDGSGEEGEGEGEEPGEGEDTDRDGLSDADELELGTDPENPDSDFDGIIDGADEDSWGGCDEQECWSECQADFDCGPGAWCEEGRCVYEGETPDGGTDSDGDGLDDETEQYLGTDPSNPDTDGDGIGDVDELYAQTDPTNADTDGDGISDAEDPEPFFDGDQDGLSDYLEGLVGTDPSNPDTDGDSYPDGEEVWELGSDPLSADGEQVQPGCGSDEECGEGAVCVDGQCEEVRQP